jgi:putative resolvase
MLVPLRKAIELTGLHPNTLRKYADNGTIEAKRVGRQRLYHVDSLRKIHAKSSIICYTRVSSTKQKDDLARQVVYMREQFPSAEIIQDIGSGLNFKRKGLKSILDRCLHGDTITLIVAHRDRLCRFGFEIIKHLIESNGGEILVLDRTEDSPERELTEDLLTILHVFSCRMHGLRRYSKQIKEDKNLSDEGTEKHL